MIFSRAIGDIGRFGSNVTSTGCHGQFARSWRSPRQHLPMGASVPKPPIMPLPGRPPAGYRAWTWMPSSGPMLVADRGPPPSERLLCTLQEVPGADRINRALYLELRHFLADHNLNYTDRMGMAAGVEVRVPLLDTDLVAFAGGLAGNAKLFGGVPKGLFKAAMESWLPREVIHRPKTGFGAPLRHWLWGELRELVDDATSSAALRQRGLFDPNGVARLRRLDRHRHLDGSYTLFALVCIELWCRIFVDGDGTRS